MNINFSFGKNDYVIKTKGVVFMKVIDTIVLILIIIGAINWGLLGFFQFDLVATIFGDMSTFSRIIYAIIGICCTFMCKALSYNSLIILNNSIAASLGPSCSLPLTPRHVLICPTFTFVSNIALKYLSINISVASCFCAGPNGFAK